MFDVFILLKVFSPEIIYKIIFGQKAEGLVFTLNMTF